MLLEMFHVKVQIYLPHRSMIGSLAGSGVQCQHLAIWWRARGDEEKNLELETKETPTSNCLHFFCLSPILCKSLCRPNSVPRRRSLSQCRQILSGQPIAFVGRLSPTELDGVGGSWKTRLGGWGPVPEDSRPEGLMSPVLEDTLFEGG